MEDLLRLRQNLILFVLAIGIQPAFAQVNVTTYHNDISRTGQNTQETVLTTSNVAYATFGRLFSVTLDGQVYAQPLVLSNVSIGGGTHNVVYAATENDTVYAIDASSGAIYWSKHLGSPVPSSELPGGGCSDISPNYGITSTPTIDTTTGTLYLVTSILQSGEPAYQLHALAVTTGAEKFGAPVAIGGSSDGITFNPPNQHIRPGLLLQNGHVIIASGSHCDIGTWYGWVMSYKASTLAQEAIFNTEPTGSDAGVWMSGNGVAADASGNLYFATGNSAVENGTDLGDNIVKLGPPPSGFSTVSHFAPTESYLTTTDMDVGSGGVVLIPSTSLLLQMGKSGDLYLVNETTMALDQEVMAAAIGLWGSPAYWNGNVYLGSARESDHLGGAAADYMKAYSFNANGNPPLSGPTSETPTTFAWPSPTPSVSSNGTSNGIVWALDNSNQAACTTTSGCSVLHAYNATNLQQELYNSARASWNADAPGASIKFSVPTIANGKVYVGTQSSLTAYGLTSRLPQADQPFFNPPSNGSFMTLTVNAMDGTPGAVFHCTINGGTATPSSPVCSNPLVSNWSGSNVTISAVATASGYTPSPAFTSTYIWCHCGSPIATRR